MTAARPSSFFRPRLARRPHGLTALAWSGLGLFRITEGAETGADRSEIAEDAAWPVRGGEGVQREMARGGGPRLAQDCGQSMRACNAGI